MVLECTTTLAASLDLSVCTASSAVRCGSAISMLASFNAKHPRSRHAHQLPHFDRLRLQMSEL